MPTYDYRCDACEVTYELRQGFDAESAHTCEECGKGVAKRVLTAPRVVFKGSGWYVTDSRKGGSSDSKTTTVDTPDAAATKTESKSESSDAAPASAPAAATDSGSSSAAAAS